MLKLHRKRTLLQVFPVKFAELFRAAFFRNVTASASEDNKTV